MFFVCGSEKKHILKSWQRARTVQGDVLIGSPENPHVSPRLHHSCSFGGLSHKNRLSFDFPQSLTVLRPLMEEIFPLGT